MVKVNIKYSNKFWFFVIRQFTDINFMNLFEEFIDI